MNADPRKEMGRNEGEECVKNHDHEKKEKRK